MPDSQKIVHLIGTLGQYDASYKLREVAAHQSLAGAQVTVVAFSAGKERRRLAERTAISCQVVHKRWSYDPFAGRQLVQTLRELEADAVYLWGRRATDAALAVRRALPDAALIATLTKVPQLANPWWPNKSLHAVDAIVVEREATKSDFVDAGQGADKIHLIRPGVEVPTAPRQSRRELLLDLGLSADARIVALAGPLERWQLADEAIWCFELIRILHECAALVIVGDGAERGRLERFTRQVTEPAVVRFCTDADRLGELLPHAEVYWQPGEGDAVPSTLLAAMAHGLPVVASDVPVHREIVRSGVNGLLVPPAKRAVWARHTDQLLRTEALRSKLGAAARQTVEVRHSLAGMVDSYNSLAREITTKKLRSCSILS